MCLIKFVRIVIAFLIFPPFWGDYSSHILFLINLVNEILVKLF